MAAILNRILKGQKASYQIVEVLKHPSVFKATVLHHLPPKPVVIKMYTSIESWQIEHDIHIQPEFQSCPYIRQLEDVIENDSPTQKMTTKSLVFEWMDTDLWQARPYSKLQSPQLPQILAKSTLKALLVLQKFPAAHIDLSPNNIFLSDCDGPNPIIRLGDMAQTRQEGSQKGNPDCQPTECRAPEVWKGLGVWHKSDIWAFGVTMVHWLRSDVLFGPSRKVIRDHTAAWCLAKIIRLIGPVGLPARDTKYFADFQLAPLLESQMYIHPETSEPTPYITIKTLRQELEAIPHELCSVDCIDFIEHLLVIDQSKRPTAEEALQHRFITSL